MAGIIGWLNMRLQVKVVLVAVGALESSMITIFLNSVHGVKIVQL